PKRKAPPSAPGPSIQDVWITHPRRMDSPLRSIQNVWISIQYVWIAGQKWRNSAGFAALDSRSVGLGKRGLGSGRRLPPAAGLEFGEIPPTGIPRGEAEAVRLWRPPFRLCRWKAALTRRQFGIARARESGRPRDWPPRRFGAAFAVIPVRVG